MLKQLPVLASLLLSVTAPGFLVLTPSRVDAADLQTIKRRGRLIVAVKDNLRPLGFRGADGQIQGFEIDLARQLAQELLGRADAVELRPVLNQDRFKVITTGEVDFAIAKVTLTPSRFRILNLSQPYYRDGAVVATRDPAIQTWANLAGKPIAVLNDSSTVEAVRRKLPTAVLISVPSYEEAKAAIERGQALAVAADASVLAGWVQEFPQYRLLSPFLSTQDLVIAFPKGQQYEELRQEIEQILRRLYTRGWLEQRANYWGLPRNLSF
ncbi:MAG: transporter substrate-binding domain-containing protein [Oscillatoriales cyanobacterium C42_A2020_001]|nr:transporter substrate-binding domain-containing protein [Leptolyngbyaceae cyanobacterium C42_A2020_001]